MDKKVYGYDFNKCVWKYKGLIVLADTYIRYVIPDMGVCICVIWMEIDLKSSQNECNEVQWVNQSVVVWLNQTYYIGG